MPLRLSQQLPSGPKTSNERASRRRWGARLLGVVALAAIGACGDAHTGDATTPDGTTPPAGEAGTPPSFGQSEAGTVTEEKCSALNIGIIGVPGEEASSNFQQWLSNAGTTTTRVQTEKSDVLTSAVLAPFDVVVFDHLMHDHSQAEVTAFQTWLTSGKGAVSMTGYLDAHEVDFRANPLIAPLGVVYTGNHTNGPATNFAAHPITKGLTSITFLGGYVVEELQGSSAIRTPLASIPAGNAGFAVEVGQGRAFVWGDEWIEFDSEWSTIPEVQQLWVQAFEWLAPTRCKLDPVK